MVPKECDALYIAADFLNLFCAKHSMCSVTESRMTPFFVGLRPSFQYLLRTIMMMIMLVL